jgi:carbamoyl-phosphate synthase large subunit
MSAACCHADAAFQTPLCTHVSYAERLVELCARERVDLVIPTIDTELPVLARWASRLAAGGTQAAISTPEAVELARNKLLTSQHLARAGVPVPRTALARQVLEEPEGWAWPLFAKPLSGSSSVGAFRVDSLEALRRCTGERDDLVVQELCTGAEYTINIFVDSGGTLRAVVPHQRIEVRAGEVNKGVTCKIPRLIELGRAVARAIPGLRGPACFQAIMDDAADGTPRVIEVNARFGGGYPLAHAAGAEFTTYLLCEVSGREWHCELDGFEDGVRMLRYEDAVFLRAGIDR